MPQQDKPNILLVMSDQHNRHVAGCYGDPIVRTPRLDGLAADGVVFTQAYCPFPLCAPTRMAFMTGRQPHELGIWDNGAPLACDVPTFAHALVVGGYHTVLCGRMHFCGPDQRHGFQQRVFPEVSGHAAGELLHTNEFRRTSLEKSGPGRNHYLLYDEECVGAATQWLAARARCRSDERPFCLVVGLVGPHCPFVCPRDLFDYYYDRVTVPQYTQAYFDQLHPYIKRFRRRSRIEGLTEHEIRRTRAAYYGMIEFDDRLVGSLLDTLDDVGLSGRTVVIYASDHGDMAGEHGLWWKMSFYEGSVGVPLIASWPGRFQTGHAERAPVSLTDLASTLTDMAGAPPIPGVTPTSLTPLLTGSGSADDRPVVSELWPDPDWHDQGPCGGPARMLRRGDWKCNYYHHEPPELFNLADDPDEMTDCSQDPGCRHILDTMVSDLLDDWDPRTVEREARRRREQSHYARQAPSDPSVLAGEYWLGPDNYGCVEPV